MGGQTNSPPSNPLNSRRQLPSVQTLTRGDVPELHGVVGGAGDEEFGGGCGG